MKREDLIKLLFGENADLTSEQKSQVDQIMALHGKSTEALKTKAETSETEAATLKKQLEEANIAIEGFKKLDVDGIKAAADDWKKKAEQAQKDAAEQLAQLKFDHALDGALAAAKAKNAAAVRALLKVDDLKLSDDGKIIGLDEQLTKVKESDAYLFDVEGADPRIVLGGKQAGANTSGETFASAIRERMSQTNQTK